MTLVPHVFSFILSICIIVLAYWYNTYPTDGNDHIELLVINGNRKHHQIWTGEDGEKEFAEAFAVSNGRFVAVGSNDYVYSVIGKRQVNQLIDLSLPMYRHWFLMPGFHDAHVHLLIGGRALLGIRLRDVKNREEFVEQIRKYMAQRKPKKGEWIFGTEWNEQKYPEGQIPHKNWIDDITPDNPVYLLRLDGHSCLVNSKAMDIANITKYTETIAGGHIEKDPITGEPTGIIKDKAMLLIQNRMPQVDDMKSLKMAMDQLVSNGITSVTHMNYLEDSWYDLDKFLRAREEGSLKIRIYATTKLSSIDDLIDYIKEKGRGDDWITWGGLKEFFDGSLGSKTAYMLEPFENTTETGLKLVDEDKLLDYVRKAYDNGLQMAVHAIGDRANRKMLDIYSKVIKESETKKDHRFRIEHAQHLHPSDISRFAELNVIASVQPCHLLEDALSAEAILGKQRALQAFCFKSLKEHAEKQPSSFPILAFGTDWPVAALDPILNIYAAVTRKASSHPDGFNPSERLSIKEALKAYTYNAAFASFNENRFGTIKEGLFADITILSQNLLEIDMNDMLNTKVMATIVGGNVMFNATAKLSDRKSVV